MIFPRKSIAILLIITLGMGPLHAATTPSKPSNLPKLLPQEKQKLLERLIMRFKATMKPIHLGPHQHFPPEIQKKVRAERRRIVKEAVAYGLGTALVLALAALGYVVLKGRGQGQAPVYPGEVPPMPGWTPGIKPSTKPESRMMGHGLPFVSLKPYEETKEGKKELKELARRPEETPPGMKTLRGPVSKLDLEDIEFDDE